jgi:hypothetical protein
MMIMVALAFKQDTRTISEQVAPDFAYRARLI